MVIAVKWKYHNIDSWWRLSIFTCVEGSTMLKRFYPDSEEKSVYEIDYEKLYKEGYRGIIFDIDNTLVPHGAPADAQVIRLFERLEEMGIGTVLLSNNQEPRVRSFAMEVHAPYIYKAGKPGSAGYEKAMQLLGTDVHSTIFIGDQLFTDVWGAKRLGMRNILVKPIHPKEELQIVWKRKLEEIVLYFYHRGK